MIATLLSQIGVPVLSRILGQALASVDSPITQQAAKALTDLDKDLPSDQVREANAHVRALTQIEMDGQAAHLKQVNESLRAEIESQDVYVRRMRPTFGYLMALTWAAQMFGVAYIIIFDPARAGAVLSGMAELTAIWGIGLSVLGVYVYKRSEDKRMKNRMQASYLF